MSLFLGIETFMTPNKYSQIEYLIWLCVSVTQIILRILSVRLICLTLFRLVLSFIYVTEFPFETPMETTNHSCSCLDCNRPTNPANGRFICTSPSYKETSTCSLSCNPGILFKMTCLGFYCLFILQLLDTHKASIQNRRSYGISKNLADMANSVVTLCQRFSLFDIKSVFLHSILNVAKVRFNQSRGILLLIE